MRLVAPEKGGFWRPIIRQSVACVTERDATISFSFRALHDCSGRLRGEEFGPSEALELDNGGGGVGGGGGTASPMDAGLAGQVHSDGSVAMADVTVKPPEAASPVPDAKADAGCVLGPTAGRCDAGVEIPTAGLYLWLSADVGVQIAGGQVTSWNDRSGAGRNATQTVAQYRPTAMANWHGGKPAIHFDGANRFLFLASGFDDFTKGLTVFLVSETLVDTACASF